jgi:DNA-binding MarR family transcriptional regulator
MPPTTSAPRAERALDPVDLASRLRLAVTRLARRLRQEAEPGLTPSLYSALAAVARGGRMTVGELCAAEQVQPPTMTRLVAALVDAGLIDREPDATDRRVAWLSVSLDGAKLLGRVRQRKEAFLSRRLRKLPAEDLEVLERAAAILERVIEGDR